MHYYCRECGHKLLLHPREDTKVLPQMFCSECNRGPQYSCYAVEFHDGTVERNPHSEDVELVR